MAIAEGELGDTTKGESCEVRSAETCRTAGTLAGESDDGGREGVASGGETAPDRSRGVPIDGDDERTVGP